MKRMSIKEIDKFIEKLSCTEVYGETARYKAEAIAYLNLFCRDIEYHGKKSAPIKE